MTQERKEEVLLQARGAWIKLGRASAITGLPRRLLLQLANQYRCAMHETVAERFGLGRNWYLRSEWVEELCDPESRRPWTYYVPPQPTTRELGRRLRRRHQYERSLKARQAED